MSDAKWLRFPVAMLAYKPDDAKGTLDAIIDHCLWTTGGSAKAAQMPATEVRQEAKARGVEIGKYEPDHLQFVRGAIILGITGGRASAMLKQLLEVRAFLAKAPVSSTKNQVNVREDWFWRAVATARGTDDKQELTWRDFRFLAALLSKVGAHKFDRCGWQEIQARAAGWCGKAEMRAAVAEEQERRRPLILTQDQIRATRDELEACNFFCRSKWRTKGPGNGGESWYSFSTEDRVELLRWITERKYRGSTSGAAKRTEDAALIAKVIKYPEPSPNLPRTLIGKQGL